MKKFFIHIVSLVLFISVIAEIIETSFSFFDFDIEISFEGEVEEELEEELEEIKSKVISLNSKISTVKLSKIKRYKEINACLIIKGYLSAEISICVPPPQNFKLT